jgi:hypothetical protein
MSSAALAPTLQVAKRKAEEAAAGQPAAKAGPGGVRKKIIDEDVTAGDDRTGGTGLDVMGVDDLQAELAVNEAAKGAVVVEAGNVQVGACGGMSCVRVREVGKQAVCVPFAALFSVHGLQDACMLCLTGHSCLREANLCILL